MSRDDSRDRIAAEWWHAMIANRESGAARGLAARFRRAAEIAVLAEPAVHELAARLSIRPAQAPTLVRLVQVLAELRSDDPSPLARRLGGTKQVLSPLRFQRLSRARDEEFVTLLRRALVIADRRCNVARLAGDVLNWDHPDWGDKVRTCWCFEYFDPRPPEAEMQPSGEMPA